MSISQLPPAAELEAFVEAHKSKLVELQKQWPDLRLYVPIENGVPGEPNLLPPLGLFFLEQDTKVGIPVTFLGVTETGHPCFSILEISHASSDLTSNRSFAA